MANSRKVGQSLTKAADKKKSSKKKKSASVGKMSFSSKKESVAVQFDWPKC